MEKQSFKQLYKEISPQEITDDVFTLAGKVFPVITAGNTNKYNSMTASGGGFGLLFKKACTWCILRTDRYTLELIQEKQTYTMSYFGDEYKDQIVFLGSKSGRDTNKMEEINLTAIQTPDKNISFKEAYLIIECKLIQITTPSLNDFCTQEAINYISEAYQTKNDYRKYVFGEICHVWIHY